MSDSHSPELRVRRINKRSSFDSHNKTVKSNMMVISFRYLLEFAKKNLVIFFMKNFEVTFALGAKATHCYIRVPTEIQKHNTMIFP